jgi:cell pole-organizing protein PopZ
MALQDPQAEPSMEEILASIRRIISEEEQAPPPEEVLDLTQQAVTEPAPIEDDIVFETEEPPPAPEPIYEAPAPRVAAPAPRPAAVAQVAAVAGDDIISPPAVSAAAGSLSRLAGSLRIADTHNQTIEGVVRELLKPMLKEWLDQNLPAIVEARVEAELERIARLAR